MKWLFFISSILFLSACTSDSSSPSETKMEEISNNSQEANSTPIPIKIEQGLPSKKTKRIGTAPVRLQMQEDIDKMHQNLMQQMESEKGLDPKAVSKYAKESILYTNLYGDSLAAEYVFNAADLYRGIGDYKKALEMWYTVYKSYDLEHPKAPHAMFQCAFTYDSVLDRKDLAKTLYDLFLGKYPNHELAKDAKLLVKNLDRTPEDLIKEFQKKNKQ